MVIPVGGRGAGALSGAGVAAGTISGAGLGFTMVATAPSMPVPASAIGAHPE